jgi:hypothetical protein
VTRGLVIILMNRAPVIIPKYKIFLG